MGVRGTELDITKNVRALEWLKTELLAAITLVYRTTLKGSEDILADALAQVLLITYLLGRRLGVSFNTLENRLMAMSRQGIADEHQLERWYGDLTALDEYLKSK